MAGRWRSQLPGIELGPRGDVSPVGRIIKRTTPVSQATSRPDPDPSRIWQADEGRISPTAGGQTREGTPTASQYSLRKTQARTYRWERAIGPGVRPATSHTRAPATDTGTRRDDPREGRTSDSNDGRTNSVQTKDKTLQAQIRGYLPRTREYYYCMMLLNFFYNFLCY